MTTTAKTSAVAAINEVNDKIGVLSNKLTREEITLSSASYLEVTGNTVVLNFNGQTVTSGNFVFDDVIPAAYRPKDAVAGHAMIIVSGVYNCAFTQIAANASAPIMRGYYPNVSAGGLTISGIIYGQMTWTI